MQFNICLSNKMRIRNRKCFNEMNRRVLPFLQFYLFFTSSCSSVFAAQPFTYNPSTLQIYNSLESLYTKTGIPYSVACPAEDKYEKNMNEKKSMGRKALFVREYYGPGKLPTVYPWCEKSFEMAAAYNREDDTIEFGYEIYFGFKNEPKNPSLSDYNNYGPVSEARSVWREIANWILRPWYPYLGDGYTGSLFFTWIPLIKLRFGRYDWNFISAKYIIYRNAAKDLTMKCDNHDLGHRLYRTKHEFFDQFYSPNKQKNIFNVVDFPEMPEDSECKRTGVCVRKYDFVKSYQFVSSYESPVSCSNLTTIPIWYEVAEELLDNLEIFLVALGQVTEYRLIIFPGVYGRLFFMTNDPEKPQVMPIYLHSDGERMPVPKILYKIVRYKSHDCNVEEKICWFDIIIVIHNHPGPVKNHMICPEDKCEEYGWEKIKITNKSKEGEGSEYIYCCKLDEEIQKKLSFNVGKELRSDLNLKQFPVYLAKDDKNIYLNRKTRIEQRLNNLKMEILEIEGSKIK